MTPPLISIVIATRNGMATIGGVLDGIARQIVDCDVELVAVDSGSTDGTLEVLKRRANQVLTIDPRSFNHGLTRNLAIDASHGTFVVLLSQDAEPADERWLANLVAPLSNRPQAAGTFARQIPRADAGAIVRHYHGNWSGSSTRPRVARIADASAFERMTPHEQMDVCTFDNVCSCIRRAVWEQHPFHETPIAEDLAWAREVLLAGFEIAYAPDAAVVHSHDRSARYEYNRTALLHQQLHALFGLRTIPTLSALGVAVASTTRLHLRVRHERDADSRVEGLWRSLALAVAWPAGQYVGGRRAVDGRHLARVEGV